MSAPAQRSTLGSVVPPDTAPHPLAPLEQLRIARDVLRAEAAAIEAIADKACPEIIDAAQRIAACQGSVIVTGIGKAGLIGQKVVATLASTGSPAHFLHPSEAIHGDLGRVGRSDLVWVFSHSGRSDEVVQILPALRRLAAGTIATTESRGNPVGCWADCVIGLGHIDEACPLGLAPSTSTTLMLATGDAVALLASRLRGFGPADFARFHPGGSLGRKLSKVERWMRELKMCRIAPQTATVREVISQTRGSSRRSGAVMIVDDSGRLAGIFTDSDLVRLLQSRHDGALDDPVESVMTRQVQTVRCGTRLGEAIEVLAGKKISELPVLDADGRPVGLLDITDVVGIVEPPRATIPMRVKPSTPGTP